MINSNIGFLRCQAPGRAITALDDELKASGLISHRGPKFFSAGGSEWTDIIIPLASGAIGAVAAILVAHIKKDNRLKIKFNENGTVQEIDAPSKEDLIEIMERLNQQRDDS